MRRAVAERSVAERSVAERSVTGDIVALTFLLELFLFIYSVCCCRDTLLVVSTVFTILSGQGEALNIDPASFYVHLYNSLFNIEAVRCALPLQIISYLQCWGSGSGSFPFLTKVLSGLNEIMPTKQKF